MNEQRLFEMTSQTNLKGHVAKSIAPFRMFGIEHTSPTQNIHPSIGLLK